MKLLACPKCHQQLHLENKTLKCENNHCYDISKRGYINLLLTLIKLPIIQEIVKNLLSQEKHT